MNDKTIVPVEQNVNMQSALLEIVQRKDIDPERLEKFIDLQFKMEERQNEKRFNEAMASFQGSCPPIKKTGKVEFKSTKYSHGELDEIVHVIRPHLKENKLSFSFNIKKGENDSELITIISHADGHSKPFSYFFNTLDDGGTSMNSSQKRRSSLTYAKRTALENALGLVCIGEDNDARHAIDNPASTEQVQVIKNIAKKTGTELKAILAYLKVDKLEDLSFYEADRGIKALKQKRAK